MRLNIIKIGEPYLMACFSLSNECSHVCFMYQVLIRQDLALLVPGVYAKFGIVSAAGYLQAFLHAGGKKCSIHAATRVACRRQEV